MSEKKLIKRICDYCNTSYTFPEGEFSPSDMQELGNWIGTVRLVPNPEGTMVTPELKHFCRTGCAINSLNTSGLILPKKELVV